MRLSPFDPWRATAFIATAIGHFQRERYQHAAPAAHKAVQSSPGFSISYVLLAAALAKLGRLDEAKAAAARVVELQPEFRSRRHFAAVGCVPPLADALCEALSLTGLPE